MLYLNIINVSVLCVAGCQSYCQCHHPHSHNVFQKIWEFWKNSLPRDLPKRSEIFIYSAMLMPGVNEIFIRKIKALNVEKKKPQVFLKLMAFTLGKCHTV